MANETTYLGITERQRKDIAILASAKEIISIRAQQPGLLQAHEMRLVALMGDLETEMTCIAQDLACEIADDDRHQEDLD